MISRRKAQGINVLRLIILTLVIGLVLLLVVNQLIVVLRGDMPREVCRTSVLAKYGTKIPGAGVENTAIDLQCFPQTLIISKEGIEKISYNGISRKKFWLKKFSGLDADKTEQDIHKAIADEMYDCWYQFHRGEFDFFGDWSGDITRCVICTDVILDPSVREGLANRDSTDGLVNFIIEENVPRADYSYLMYFFNIDDNQDIAASLQEIDEGFEDDLKLGEQYSIVYYMSKSSAWSKIWVRSAEFAAGGAAIGAAIGLGPGSWLTAPVGALAGGGIGLAGGIVAYGVFEADVAMPGMVIKKTNEVGEICDTLY